ncbi:MAG TPA: ligase-associated DNA damage response endonuclease PdeM [Chitinophagaceae bacterium]|nr:ligase-associated DNA damage response endonuclease PdeM [Chitinophagaceae bacterium]
MQAPIPHKILDQTFWLSAQRCAFWEAQKALIVSDLHFGKTGHFRKAGIPVPQSVFKEDLQRLLALIDFFKPTQIIAVGDLFHSQANLELELFKRWREGFPDLQFHLVKGNHDILKKSWYAEAGLTVWDSHLQIGSFYFNHDNCLTTEGAFSFCGHLHPGITLHGIGKQSLRFPCFYFAHNQCILPAFSRFTGLAAVNKRDAESVYAIVDSALIKL